MRFGEFFKNRRIELRLTLRSFCSVNGFDPGNISKIERSVLPPPQSDDLRRRYATALGIHEGTDDWLIFFDLASAECGTLPPDIASDSALVSKLPLIFRTVRGSKLSETQIRDIISELKNT